LPNYVPRRQFLQAGLALSTIRLNAQTIQSANAGRIRFGIIGVGMEGSGLLGAAITLPGVECVGAADLYDARHTLAKEITGNPNLFTTRRYHELLERKDVDCILAAVPDHWHMRVVVDACNAGKDIYCEKPMSHTPSQGFEMIDAADRNNRIVQIGSQRVSSALCAKARELYHDGAIGDVEMVGFTLHRRVSRLRIWIGTPGSTMRRRFLSALNASRAGAAGRNMAPAWAAI
jgi:predicted dehydrogenase